MNWKKYSHNKRNMSRAYCQRKGYHAQIAPSSGAKARKEKLLQSAKKSSIIHQAEAAIARANEVLRQAALIYGDKGGITNGRH